MKPFLLAVILALFLSAPANAHDLTWDWTQTPGGVAPIGFNVFRKKATETVYTLLATPDATARSYSDPDRTVGNCYSVSAYGQFGTSPGVTVCALGPDGSISILVIK